MAGQCKKAAEFGKPKRPEKRHSLNQPQPAALFRRLRLVMIGQPGRHFNFADSFSSWLHASTEMWFSIKGFYNRRTAFINNLTEQGQIFQNNS
jgi:hypothetical protein